MIDLTLNFKIMTKALFVAYKALINSETPVGCIVLDDDNKIVSIGYNLTNRSLNGTKHAEFVAFERLKNENSSFLKNLTVYVTVEPCIMCASLLRQLGIKKVIYGCRNDRFGGNGTILSINKSSFLLNDDYLSYGGIMRTESIQLLRIFYLQTNKTAPNPKIKKKKLDQISEYPKNIFNISSDEFLSFYGNERKSTYDSHKEITPIVNQSYNVKQLVTFEDVKSINFLDSELGETNLLEYNNFVETFYPINKDGNIIYV